MGRELPAKPHTKASFTASLDESYVTASTLPPASIPRSTVLGALLFSVPFLRPKGSEGGLQQGVPGLHSGLYPHPPVVMIP